MERYDIEKLRCSCEGVAQRLGLTVNHHKALCPFHDDHHASMTFKGYKFRCWSCGESGDSISLVQKVLGKSFLDACRWLADEHNIILNCTIGSVPLCTFDASRYERYFERPWLSPEARRFLFEERRLDERVVRWCRLTSWRDKQGVPWLQIPYYNREGKLVGVQNRNLVCGALPRFRFPCGSQCGIYNLPVLNLLKPGDELYIAEGCSDCWSLLSAGHKAIAIPSATLLTKKDKEQLLTLNPTPIPSPKERGVQNQWTTSTSNITNPSPLPSGGAGGGSQVAGGSHMWPDNDAPGERLFLQLKEVLPSLVHHQLPSDCKDYSDYYLRYLCQKC